MKVEQQQDLKWMAPWSQKFCQVTCLPLMISKTLYVLTFPTYSIFTVYLLSISILTKYQYTDTYTYVLT